MTATNYKPCPACGAQMTCGVPHGPCVRQWECHRCGHIQQETGALS